MKTTIDTAIEQQSLSPDYSTSSPTESSLEVLNDMEFDLESIIAKEFGQGLPSDIDSGDF